MTFLNTKAVLDDAQTIIQDSSTILRAKMLTWLNNIFQRLGNEFPWSCTIKTSTPLTVTANAVTLPTDFSLVDKLTLGNYKFMTVDEVNERNSFLWAGGGTTPIGYYIVGNTLTLVPGTSEVSATLRYNPEIPKYTDGTSDTAFSSAFGPIVQRALLDMYYEYDADNRASLAVPFNQEMLRGLIAKELRNPDVARKYQFLMERYQAPAPAGGSK